MDATLTEIIAAVVALGGIIGGAIKFVLDRMTASTTRIEAERVRYELRIDQERIRHEAVVADQIASMRREIDGQDHEIARLRSDSAAYVRHIAVLEGLMRAAGMTVPTLQLPVYPSASI